VKRKPIPQKVRRRVYEKYGGRCAYCGQPIAYRDMQVEHLVPLAKGGASDKIQIYGQVGLAQGHAFLHGAITGLKTA